MDRSIHSKAHCETLSPRFSLSISRNLLLAEIVCSYNMYSARRESKNDDDANEDEENKTLIDSDSQQQRNAGDRGWVYVYWMV